MVILPAERSRRDARRRVMTKSTTDDTAEGGIPLVELRRAAELRQLGAFIEALPVAVFVTDASGSPCYSNVLSRQILGKGVIPETGSTELADAHDAYVANTNVKYPAERMPIVRALSGVTSHVDDMEIQHPGKRVPLEVHGAPILDATGAVCFAVATFVDITERNATRLRLQIADRMASVGTLAAGVAHEINNPLAYVSSNLTFATEELQQEPGRWSEVLEALAEARMGTERVRTIVRDLKTFSRPHEDTLQPVDVNNVLQASLNMAWNEIRHRARLVKHLGDVPKVMASEARLGQVFLNLLVNAAQAIPVGSIEKNEIRLSTSTDAGKGRVVVEVADTGPGIPPETLNRIFDPFFTTKPIGTGTGLGLAICQGIVHTLGGELKVQTDVGKGTCFQVVLPVAPMDLKDPAPSLRGAPPTPRKRVLLIDDEPLIGKALGRTLRSHHDVVYEPSARKALTLLLGGEPFDVILCDLMMPEMTGMEIHRELLRQRPAIARSMVFMTGGAFAEDAQRFLDEVPNRRLEKPCDHQALLQLLGE